METAMVSFSVPGVIVTRPRAFGRHAVMPAVGLSLNVNESACGPLTAAPAEVTPTLAAAAPTMPSALMHAAVRARTRRLGNVGCFMIGILLSRWRPARAPPTLASPGPGCQAGVRTGDAAWFTAG